MAKLGFLGLGLMGAPMARNLLKAGHDVALWSHSGGKAAKIAAEAGVIAKPAVAEAADFYVYENWLAGPHKIVLHRSGCGQCNHGKGRPSGHDPNHARWHGPYPTLAEAREASHQMPGVLIRSECKCI